MTTAHEPGFIPTFERHDRMAKAIAAAGSTRAKAAEYVGVRPETMSRYLSGKSEPPLSVVRSIALYTGVPFAWIQTGEAPSPDGDGASECARRDSNPKPSGLELAGPIALVAA